MFNVAVAAPADLGVKVTETVQLVSAARLEPQLLDCANAAGVWPVTLIPFIICGVWARLVTVTTCGGLVWPTLTLPKLRLVGEISKAIPVPVSVTVCGLFGALSVSLRPPLTAPARVGAKATEIVQLAFTARVVV